MTTINLSTVKSLLFTFSPFLISWGISKYRSLRSQVQANKPSVRPAPPAIRRLLNALFLASFVFLVLSLPLFGPENIFQVTTSRLSTSQELLLKRLAQVRHDGLPTPEDMQLLAKLDTAEARALYLLHGPGPLVGCMFCEPEAPRSYMAYALPEVLGPHLLNLFLLGLSTSAAVAGWEGSRWRLHAILAAMGLALADVGAHYNVPYLANLNAVLSTQLVYYYAWIRLGRFLGLALLDAGFAGLLWATSTNRLLVQPFTASERVDLVGSAMEMTAAKLSALAIVRNSSVRSEELREKSEEYWRNEGEVMREVMTSEDVSKTVSQALASGRVTMEKLEADARTYSDNLMQTIKVEQNPR